jgi:polygalacturonase
VVPPGRFVTGAIRLKSNVNHHVSEGATLVFQREPREYLPAVLTRFEGVELMNYSHYLRPSFVQPYRCRDVLIEGCTFDTGDDCIALKSGRNADGRRVNVPVENVVVRDCVMKDGHGGVVIGSEVSGGARNVFAERCG